jgi:hypothetical protein
MSELFVIRDDLLEEGHRRMLGVPLVIGLVVPYLDRELISRNRGHASYIAA